MSRLEAEREAFARDPVAFGVECLSIPVWPDLAGATAGPISVVDWDELADPLSEVPDRRPHEISGVVLGLDTSPERGVWLALAGRRSDDDLHGEIVGRFQGAEEAVRRITRLFERDDIDVRAIVADGEPANLDIINRLERDLFYGKPNRYLRPQNAARAGPQACGVLVDLVASRAFRHRGQQELSVALRGAVVKPLGEAWIFSRTRSRSDVSPLLALACALHVASVELDLEPAGAVQIY